METDNIFPDNWKEVLRGKKVIFYNTSVGSMLSGREKHIEKMKWVFGVFQQHPEVVLWWRPHPLELSTIQSMIPELEEQYKELRRQYREKSVGILDESTDLHRAIAISDAYYGDWSSVVHLYKYKGAPILIANDIVSDIDDRTRLVIADFGIDIDANRMWALSAQYNFLFEVKLDSMEVRNAFRFPIGFPYTQGAMKYLIQRKDNLSIISRLESKSMVFHTNTKECTLSNIIPFDVCEYSNYYTETNDSIFIISKFANKMIKIKKNDMSIQEIVINGIETGFEGLAKLDNVFILIQAKSNYVYVWDEKNKTIEKIGELPDGFRIINEYYLVGGMISLQESIIVFPQFTNMIIEVNIKEKKIKQVGKCFENDDFLRGPLFTCAKKINNLIYVYANYLDEWIIYNLDTGESNRKHFMIPNNIEKQINDNNMFDRGCMETHNTNFEEQENYSIFSLPNYIENLRNKSENNQKLLYESNCGKEIYNTV